MTILRAFCILLFGSTMFAQEENTNGGRWQARSMVETKFGIVDAHGLEDNTFEN